MYKRRGARHNGTISFASFVYDDCLCFCGLGWGYEYKCEINSSATTTNTEVSWVRPRIGTALAASKGLMTRWEPLANRSARVPVYTALPSASWIPIHARPKKCTEVAKPKAKPGAHDTMVNSCRVFRVFLHFFFSLWTEKLIWEVFRLARLTLFCAFRWALK